MTPQARPRRRPPRSRWLREIRLVWCGGWTRLYPRLWIIGLGAIVGLTLVWLGDDVDKALASRIHVENAQVTSVAAFISHHSDLELCTPLAVALWAVGAVTNRARWRRLGLACLMATLMAGATVQTIKRIPGRPRPGVALTPPRIFYGPSNKARYHSFPSGHTATSSATGMSLVAACPIMAVPGAIYAASVGWSRIQLQAHFPLDVAMGGLIGIVCGGSFASTVPGSVIRWRRRKRRRTRRR
jgi:membrane-associated phospholipid phosphatase